MVHFGYKPAHRRPRRRPVRPAWWTLALALAIAGIVAVCSALFAGVFDSDVPVTLTTGRAGLMMEPGAKVKMRGVQVGVVVGVELDRTEARLQLRLSRDDMRFIPSNVAAQIRSTTLFGSKYVDLQYPAQPSGTALTAGSIIESRHVTSELNTVFQNLTDLLSHVDPAKLNSVLTALADGLRGKGATIGEAITSASHVLRTLNPLMDEARADLRSLKAATDAYSVAAPDILAALDHLNVTSSTIKGQRGQLDALLLSAVGFSNAGIELLGPNQTNLVESLNILRPTTDLLMKYNPIYTCLLLGAKWFLDNGGYASTGGNGYSAILDGSALFGSDPYRYPDNLPRVAAKGGPGGKPGCGSLPDASKNFPVRQLITDTGFGTGLDFRPNPGIGHPWYVNFFPTTRAAPEPPSIRSAGPPAIGPVPYPGAPAYGAPPYDPGGAPPQPPVTDTPPTPAQPVAP
ncbi:MCE family protein [Mycobacterium sp. 3519A]|uniref:MCE family protein n=1 Tax=Mycobacterium sp. 3519A TaxID=2057184 RepID=UPI001F2902AF|nr:MCE family protein [Mycobacterium sp. 3519A]